MSLIATLAIAATLGATPASPSTTPVATTPAPQVVKLGPDKVLGCTQKRFRHRVDKVYAKKRISKKDHRWIFEARKCLKHQYKAKIYQRQKSAQRKQRIQIQALTPYRGPNGTRWAIPWYIVSCESKGSWTAYNSSGAAGPYQIMSMHGRPFPVTSAAQRLRHHQIAAKLWAGGRGASHWVCA